MKLALASLGALLLTTHSAGQVIEPAPAVSPTSTSSPTFTDVCYVCGDPSLAVDPSLDVAIGEEVFDCGVVELFGLSRLASPGDCQLLESLVVPSCNCSPIDGAVPAAPTPAPTTAPVPTLSETTASPTFTDVCYVCGGDPSLAVDPSLDVAIGEDVFDCGVVELFGLSRLASPDFCEILELLVPTSCNCSPIAPPTPSPAGGATGGTSAPTFVSEPCDVCGDSDLFVDPTQTVMIGEDTFTCGFVEDNFQEPGLFTPDACAILVQLVVAQCGCMNPDDVNPIPPTSPTPPPAPSPTTTAAAPTLAPVPNVPTVPTEPMPEEVNRSSSGDSSSFNAAYLASLAVIPIVGIGLFVYFKQRKSKHAAGDAKQPVAVSEVNAGSSPPVNEEEPDVFYPPPTAPAATRARRINEPPSTASASASEDDYHHSSTAEASASSGRSRGPGASYRYSGKSDSGAAADLRASGRSDTGGYLPDTKDQCRSVARGNRGENAPPDTVIVEAVAVPDEDMAHLSVSTGDGTGESRRSRRSIDP